MLTNVEMSEEGTNANLKEVQKSIKELLPDAAIKFDKQSNILKVHVQQITAEKLKEFSALIYSDNVLLKRSGTGITMIVDLPPSKGEA